jgi:hypothetical protein
MKQKLTFASVAVLAFASGLIAAKPASNTQEKLKETIARAIALNPGIAIDFSDHGEYCLNVNFDAGGKMTHFAADPTKTEEDVVDILDARPLMKAGLDPTKLPKLPGFGKMKPYVWYHHPAGEPEPHHGGASFEFPLLLRASNVK